jgi:hypothetical protein
MGVIGSLRKQWKLRRISGALGAPFEIRDEIEGMLSGTPSKKERALEQLLDLCEHDAVLRQIMQQHGADRETLRSLYWEMTANGAAQWEGGHFVPASALGYGFPLVFLLENAGKLPSRHICILLLEYFERNDVGPVPLEVRGPANTNDPLHRVWELEQKVKRDE